MGAPLGNTVGPLQGSKGKPMSMNLYIAAKDKRYAYVLYDKGEEIEKKINEGVKRPDEALNAALLEGLREIRWQPSPDNLLVLSHETEFMAYTQEFYDEPLARSTGLFEALLGNLLREFHFPVMFKTCPAQKNEALRLLEVE